MTRPSLLTKNRGTKVEGLSRRTKVEQTSVDVAIYISIFREEVCGPAMKHQGESNCQLFQYIFDTLPAKMTTSGSLILITGASGFVGNHTLANFLTHGYRVRVVARNQASCDRILNVHSTYRKKLETAIVSDITVPGAFDDAVKGVDGIIHMASPFVINVEDNEKDLILPALNGTRGILESAQRYGPQVRRIVITSSFAAVADFTKGLWPGHIYDETQWNPLTYEETKNDQRGLAYA